MHRPIPISIIVPTDHMVMKNQPLPELNKPHRICFILEGINGCSVGPILYSRLVPLAEDNNVIVVTVGGENKWYTNSEITKDNYHDMIARDLLNFMRATFNISEEREDTMIGGFSMGGFGALVVGFANPDKFGKVFAIEPALNREIILEAPEIPTWDLYTRKQYEVMFGVEKIADMAGTVNDYMYTAKEVVKSGYSMQVFITASPASHMCSPALRSFVDTLKDIGMDVTYQDDYQALHSYLGFDEGIERAFKWMRNDTFGGNFIYFGKEAVSSAENFAHWDTWYNVQEDAKKAAK
jgi:S-formylglutathione hydrolase FrmB